jgi:hypothetical protein
VRYLTADTHPDHDTICAFRRNNLNPIAAAFVDVLELAQELKLLKLGTVSLDGTHLRASACKDKNVTCERAQQLRTQLRRDVKELLQQTEGADQQDEDPQALPREIARREKLLAKMDAPAPAWSNGPKNGPRPGGPITNAKWPRANSAKVPPKARRPSHRRPRPSPTSKSTSPIRTRA